MYVIGTAGHVDHSKSTLVKALTGIEPAWLPEEKARETHKQIEHLREGVKFEDPVLS